MLLVQSMRQLNSLVIKNRHQPLIILNNMASKFVIPFGILNAGHGSIDCLTFSNNGRIMASKSSKIAKRSRKQVIRDPAG